MRRFIFLSITGLALIMGSITPFLPAQASAATNATWVSATQIKVNGATYTQCQSAANCSAFTALQSGSYTPSDYFVPSGWGNMSDLQDGACSNATHTVNAAYVNKTIVVNQNGSYQLETYFSPATPYQVQEKGGVTQTNYHCSKFDTLALGSQPTTLPTVNGKFLNASVIQLNNGDLYEDGKLDSGKNFYKDGADTGPCGDLIEGFSSNNKTATLYAATGINLQTGRSCDPNPSDGGYAKTATVTLDTSEAAASYKWVSSTTIETSDNRTTYVQDSSTATTYAVNNNGGDCTQIITKVSPNDDTKNSTGFIGVKNGSKSNCTPGAQKVTISAYNATDPGTIAAQNNLSNPDATTKPTCESSGFPLDWIICAGVNLLAKVVDGIYDNMVEPLLNIQPLQAQDASGTFSPTYVAWSNFRIYGDIFLVIALLVIVFGESIGGGIVDAYTAKKVLPRLLIAAVLINLSFYIVGVMVDLTNILGAGLRDLLTAPFQVQGGFALTVKAGAAVPTLTFGAAVLSAFALPGVFGELIAVLGVFVLLPAFLLFIAIMFTILIRQALVILLVVVSPVAFALYCLPNTEQYFRRWWTMLFRTLLVYPIISVLFALGTIMSVVIGSLTSTGILQVASVFLTIIAIMAPLVLIPFAFQIAGDILGKLHDTFTNYGKKAHQGILGNPNDQRSLRNRTRRNARSAYNDQRNALYNAAATRSKSKPGSIRSGLFGAAARRINYGNLQAERAIANKEEAELAQAQYSFGDDENQRAYWAEEYRGGDDGTGRVSGGWYSPYQNDDGTYKQFASSDVAKARQIIGRNPSVMQAVATYEGTKVSNRRQYDQFKRRFAEQANAQGWTESQANGVWGGIKFAQQASRKEDKHVSLEGDKGNLSWGEINHSTLSNELVDTVRKGEFAGFRDTVPLAAIDGYTTSHQRLARVAAGEDPSHVYVPTKAGQTAASLQGADQQIVDNYKLLASHLKPSFERLGTPGSSADPAAVAAREAILRESADEESLTGGYGVGASARAEQGWKKFIGHVEANP